MFNIKALRSKSKTNKVGALNDNKGNVATDNDEMCEILNTFVVPCLRTKM